MSIEIRIGMLKLCFDNTKNIIDYINTLEKDTKHGIDLIVFLYDKNTTNFHRYEFEYYSNSKLSPRKWLLNNILYSITCRETQENMKTLFNDVKILLENEYKKL